jgi:hypothetical protein
MANANIETEIMKVTCGKTDRNCKLAICCNFEYIVKANSTNSILRQDYRFLFGG